MELKEQLTIAAFVGRRILPAEVLRYTLSTENGTGPYADCTVFVISLQALAGEPETAEAFRITPRQTGGWKKECSLFYLLLYVKDGTVAGVHISKRLRSALLPEGYETVPTKADLRVIRCLLQAVTEPVA